MILLLPNRNFIVAMMESCLLQASSIQVIHAYHIINLEFKDKHVQHRIDLRKRFHVRNSKLSQVP